MNADNQDFKYKVYENAMMIIVFCVNLRKSAT